MGRFNEIAPHGEGNICAPSVLIDGGKWKMWYGGQGKDINDPSVIKVGSTFYMYFTRAEKFVIDRICIATSTDGVHWEQKGLALDAGPKDSWDSLSVGRPTVKR